MTRTHSPGVLLTSGFFGGEIASHPSHGEPFVAHSVLPAAVYFAEYLRNPESSRCFRSA